MQIKGAGMSQKYMFLDNSQQNTYLKYSIIIRRDMSDNQDNNDHEPNGHQQQKRKQSISESMQSYPEEKPIVLWTSEDFQEWADDAPLDIEHEESMYGVKVAIREATTKGSGLLEYTIYNVVCEDQNGSFNIERRYSQFNYLRKKLKQRWPGIFIPAIPNKQILNKNDLQVTKNRQRFLNDFLYKISNLPYLYNSQQVQVFLKGQGADISKVLEKFKKQTIPQLLKKYQQAFPECVDKDDVTKERENIALFDEFLKNTQKVMQDLKKQSRQLAQSKDKYDKIAASVFENILPRYEMNTLIEFVEADQSGCIFTSGPFRTVLDLEAYKQTSTINPYWLLYDLLKFQQRQAKGMKETIQQLGELIQKREQMLKKMEINKQEISELSNGKTTLRSLIIPGNKEQIVVKLKAENEELDLHKEQILQIINIATIHLSNQITSFKRARVQFYHRVVKKVFGVQMRNAQVALQYNTKLDQISENLKIK